MDKIDAKFVRLNSLNKHKMENKEEQKEESQEEEADYDEIRSVALPERKYNLPINNL